jgi:hypothetical protein
MRTLIRWWRSRPDCRCMGIPHAWYCPRSAAYAQHLADSAAWAARQQP